MGFESPSSDTCIECPITDTQGVDLVTGECVKCDKDLQFWNPYGNTRFDFLTKRRKVLGGKCQDCNRKLSIITQKQNEDGTTTYECVLKTDDRVKKATKEDMRKCFACKTSELFKKCATEFDELTDPDKADCFIND